MFDLDDLPSVDPERDLPWSLHCFGLLLVVLDDRARIVAVALDAGSHGVTIADDQVERRLEQKREWSRRRSRS